MTTAPNILDPHLLAAEDILSVMIHSEEHCYRAELDLHLHYGWMPTPQHAHIYRAIMELRKAGQQGTIHDTLALDAAKQYGGAFSLDLYNMLYAAGIDKYEQIDALLVDNFNASAEIVIRYGRARALGKALTKWTNDLKTGKAADGVLKEMSDVAAFAGRTSARLENVHAADLVHMARSIMAQPPRRGLRTGVPLIDELTGGFSIPRFWQIAGAYKQRKTTLALNFMLSVLFQGGSVCFLSREMLREQVTFNFIAMLAVAWIRRNGHYSKTFEVKSTGEKLPVHLISADNLRQAGDGYKSWNPISRDAVDAGMEMFASFGRRLRVYDTTPEGGALSDMHSAEMVYRRDKMLENCDLMAADYAGLFGAEGAALTEQYEYRARKFQTMLSLGTPILVLVQRTEEGVKRSATADDESHSPSAYGGGAFPAAADYLMLVRYEELDGNRESNLTVTMKNTRHSQGGKETYQIHSPSGLLLANTWL